MIKPIELEKPMQATDDYNYTLTRKVQLGTEIVWLRRPTVGELAEKLNQIIFRLNELEKTYDEIRVDQRAGNTGV